MDPVIFIIGVLVILFNAIMALANGAVWANSSQDARNSAACSQLSEYLLFMTIVSASFAAIVLTAGCRSVLCDNDSGAFLVVSVLTMGALGVVGYSIAAAMWIADSSKGSLCRESAPSIRNMALADIIISMTNALVPCLCLFIASRVERTSEPQPQRLV